MVSPLEPATSPPPLGSSALLEATFGWLLFFQFFPALELLHEQGLDLRAALAVGAQGVGGLPVILGIVHPGVQRLLLGFEGFDLLRQRLQLAGFFVAELGFGFFTNRNPPLARSAR